MSDKDNNNLTINLSCIIDEDFKSDLRELIREIVQEELDKKKFVGIEHLRKVILANKSGDKVGEGI